MADDTSSQPHARSYAALTDDQGTLSDDNHTILIGSCVAGAAVARSGLLSGLEGTEGLASLPCRLSPDDVRLWETACLVGSDYKCVTAELVTIAKVADALGDTESTTWQDKLVSATLSTDWQHADQANDMLAALLSLPPHLLHRVLSSSLQRESMSQLLSTFPAALHSSLASIAAEQRQLIVPYVDAPTLLPYLMTPPAANPGQLQQLHLGDATDPPRPSHSDTVIGALLGRAASAHPSLTRLHLGRRELPPQWLRNFSSCLSPGALPQLQDITLTADGQLGSCAELAACLRLLPALTSLYAAFVMPENPPETAESLTAYARLAARPAALPHLQSLRLTDNAPGVGRAAVEQGRLHPSFTLSILPLISAPAVSSLQLVIRGDPPPLPALLSKLCHFSSVQKLYICTSISTPDAKSVPDVVGAKSLPALADITIHGTCAKSAVVLASALALLARASLTSLSLCPDTDEPGYVADEDSMAPAVTHAWAQLSPAIAGCTGLKQLALKCLGCSPETRGVFSGHLAAALVPLVQLTHLRLMPMRDEFEMPLEAGVISGGLSCLTALEVLRFEDNVHNVYGSLNWPGRLQFETMQPVIDVCVQLSKLRRVKLCCLKGHGVTLTQMYELLQGRRSLEAVICSMNFEQMDADESEQLFDELQDRFPGVEIAEC